MNDPDNSLENKNLEYTNNIRKQLIGSIKNFDVEEMTAMKLSSIAQVLADMDRVELAKMKMKSDEGISNNSKHASLLITEMYKKINYNNIKDTALTGEIKELSSVRDVGIIDGELSTGIPSMTYDDFIKNNQK